LVKLTAHYTNTFFLDGSLTLANQDFERWSEMVSTYISFQNTMTFSRLFLDKKKSFLDQKNIQNARYSDSPQPPLQCPFLPWQWQFTFVIKVAEHSFQEPIPNSPLLFSYSCFGAHFCKVNHRRVYSCILAKGCVVSMATGLVKNKA